MRSQFAEAGSSLLRQVEKSTTMRDREDFSGVGGGLDDDDAKSILSRMSWRGRCVGRGADGDTGAG